MRYKHDIRICTDADWHLCYLFSQNLIEYTHTCNINISKSVTLYLCSLLAYNKLNSQETERLTGCWIYWTAGKVWNACFGVVRGPTVAVETTV